MSAHKPPERIEIELEHVRDRFSQVVAVLIVLATLVGAVVEFLHERDNDRANQAGLQAQRLAVQAPGDLNAAQQQAMVQFEGFALAEEERTSGGSAFQGRLTPPAHPGPAAASDQQRLGLDEVRWNTLAAMTQAGTAIKPDNQYGPEADPRFPTHYLVDSQVGPDRDEALQDAANEERNLWSAKATDYVAIITVIAVALYLLGLSLTLHLGVRRVLAGVGLILVVAGSVWAMTVQLRPVPHPSERAAEEFARGRAALSLAYLQHDNSGYQDAYKHYSESIRLRPTFARAYLERSAADFLIGSPQHSDFVSVTTRDSLVRTVADLEKARSLGLVSKRVLNNLAANYFLLGLKDARPDYYRRAIGFLDQALKLDPGDPLLHYNRGISLLVDNRFAEARLEYQRAVDLSIYERTGAERAGPASPSPKATPKPGSGPRQLSGDAYSEEQLVGGSVTPLELVAQTRPELAERVREIKEIVVGGIALQGRAPGAARRPVTGVHVDIFPATLQWVAAIPDLDPADVISVQWYQLDSAKRGWAIVPEVSGILPRCVQGVSFQCLARNSQGQYFVTSHYLELSSRCLTDGTYRVELYINGRLVGSQQQATATTFSLDSLQAAYLSDLGLALCRPTGWNRSPQAQRGYTDGFVSPDGQRGLYVFRYRHPSLTGTREQAVADDLKRSVEGLASRYPKVPVFDSANNSPYFMGLFPIKGANYGYAGGGVLAEAGYSADGTVVVASIFGQTSWFSGDEPYRIFESLIQR